LDKDKGEKNTRRSLIILWYVYMIYTFSNYRITHLRRQCRYYRNHNRQQRCRRQRHHIHNNNTYALLM